MIHGLFRSVINGSAHHLLQGQVMSSLRLRRMPHPQPQVLLQQPGSGLGQRRAAPSRRGVLRRDPCRGGSGLLQAGEGRLQDGQPEREEGQPGERGWFRAEAVRRVGTSVPLTNLPEGRPHIKGCQLPGSSHWQRLPPLQQQEVHPAAQLSPGQLVDAGAGLGPCLRAQPRRVTAGCQLHEEAEVR